MQNILSSKNNNHIIRQTWLSDEKGGCERGGSIRMLLALPESFVSAAMRLLEAKNDDDIVVDGFNCV